MKTHHRLLGEDTCNAFNSNELYKQKIHKENLPINKEKANNPRAKQAKNVHRKFIEEAA